MPLRIRVQDNPPAIDSAITVISPNGGEVFEPGSTQEILWENNYGGSDFNIFYTKNDGAN